MKKFIVIIFMALFVLSCEAQNSELELHWKVFESKEAGIKVHFPCEPKKSFKSFQEQPRPIHVYEFSCEIEGMKFLVSSKDFLDEYNETTLKQTFDSNEFILKKMFGEVEKIDKKENFLTDGFPSKYYELKPKVGGKVKEVIILSKLRSYDAMFGVTPENEKILNKKKINTDQIRKKFIDSLQIIE